MKICFPSKDTKPDLQSAMDQNFGRAKCYIIYDTSEETFTTHINSYVSDESCQRRDVIASLGVDVVVSRRLGNRAMEKFKKFGIDVWKADNSSTVQETLNKFIIGGFFIRQKPEGCENPIAK